MRDHRPLNAAATWLVAFGERIGRAADGPSQGRGMGFGQGRQTARGEVRRPMQRHRPTPLGLMTLIHISFAAAADTFRQSRSRAILTALGLISGFRLIATQGRAERFACRLALNATETHG
jgi:hypothetical protein